MNYKNVYNKLYDAGYESGHTVAHGMRSGFVEAVNLLRPKSLIDIGAANGSAVRWFQENGVDSIGVEVSTVAVRQAIARGNSVVQGDACDIPFPDNYAECVYSTETLEHIAPSDVLKALQEICRVSSKYVALQVSTRADRAHWKDVVGHDLHLTVQPIQYWIDRTLEVSGGHLIYLSGNQFVVRLPSSDLPKSIDIPSDNEISAEIRFVTKTVEFPAE